MHKNLYIARKEQRMTQEKAAKLIAQRTYQSKSKADMISPKEAQN